MINIIPYVLIHKNINIYQSESYTRADKNVPPLETIE